VTEQPDLAPEPPVGPPVEATPPDNVVPFAHPSSTASSS
jgi:hypothetical protein